MAILSYVHEIQTVYNVVQNPQMILLSGKGAHGVSSRCEKVGMLLPQRSYGSTLKNHMLLITNSTTCHGLGCGLTEQGYRGVSHNPT